MKLFEAHIKKQMTIVRDCPKEIDKVKAVTNYKTKDTGLLHCYCKG